MKIRITAEQLQELMPEQQERLRELWKPQIGDVYFYHLKDDNSYDSISVVNYEYSYGFNNCLPLLDIGQMIELLVEQKAFVHFTIWDSKSETKGIDYHKTAIIDGIDEDCSNAQYESEEIVDALWQVVKQVI